MLNIKEEEEKLILARHMLGETCNWWAREIQMKISRFQHLQEKLYI